jgi:gamma-glutamyltranspeptidase/glutathione hydrolase
LNERFGSKPLAECLAPAIHHATDGFPLSPIISGYFILIGSDPSMAKVYHPGGEPPQYGDIFKNPMLAKSYQSIADEGPSAFYEGWIAEQIVAKSNEMGGKMSMKDLADHTANWVDPVSANYRGWDVWEIPPNGQGIAALQILNIMETFDVGAMEPNSAEHLHYFIEAKKLAYEDRAIYYADPEFADVPTDRLISKDYAAERAKLIKKKKAARDVPYGDPDLDSDTIYMTAADGDGNMISLIQSVYSAFGSRICPDDVGFHMQDRGRLFALDENHRNKLEPHKRPFHTIIPAFLTKDSKPVMSFGVMGGAFQPQGHAQVIMNMIDFGMSPQQAADQPRIEHNGSSEPTGERMKDGGSVKLEPGIAEDVRKKLNKMGHELSDTEGAFGGYQAIWREDDPLRYFGGSDPRKDGAAIGY